MTYTDYNVCFKRCRVIVWNDAELSYAHTQMKSRTIVRKIQSLVELKWFKCCKIIDETSRTSHILHFPIHSWMSYKIKSFELKTIEKVRTNWRYVGRYVDEPCMLFTITSARLTIDKLTNCEWVITIITTSVLNDAESSNGTMQSNHMHIPQVKLGVKANKIVGTI